MIAALPMSKVDARETVYRIRNEPEYFILHPNSTGRQRFSTTFPILRQHIPHQVQNELVLINTR